MTKPPTRARSVSWPVPPFFRRDVPAPNSVARNCRVEFLDGTTVTGNLVAFDPATGVVELKAATRGHNQVIDFARVRIIKRDDPIELRPDAKVLRGIGARESTIGDDKAFTMQFSDGVELKGRTRGWVKESYGLFLFVVEAQDSLPLRYFVPSHAIGDVKIGPLIGEALAASKLISERALAAALAKQETLRHETLGKILQDRALVTRDDLERALRKQRNKPNVRVGQLLLEAKLISQEQLDTALASQTEKRRRPLGEILIEMGAVTAAQVQSVLAAKLGIPMVNIRDFKIDPTVLQLVPAPVAFRHQALPLLKMDNALVIAVENPMAVDLSSDLRFATGLVILPVMADGKELKARIGKEYGDRFAGAIAGDFEGSGGAAKEGAEGNPRAGRSDATTEDLVSALSRETGYTAEQPQSPEADARVSDSALVKLVNKIIIEAYGQGASDIHIETNPGKSAIRIRFRKDGRLEDYLELEPAYRNSLLSRLKIMANLDISERRHAQDGKIDFGRFGPLRIELRVAILPTANGLEDVVLRILGGSEPLPMEKLGLSERNLAECKKMVTRNYGIILVCGPTGSGKTTTLHSILKHINRPDLKIWTAEDPIEITQPGLRQVQINPKIDWTFAAAMRAFLRADPDVIMVGEMRDQETAKIGIEASLTGHLIFSTLHTNSAAESVVRLLDIGIDQFTFADALIGILSQRLARRLCPNCKGSHPATTAEIAEIASEYCLESDLDHDKVIAEWTRKFGAKGKLILHKPIGCEQCAEGYKGRVGLHELLVATPKIKHLIHERASVRKLVAAAQSEGTLLLRQDAIEKIWQGQLDLFSAHAAYY